MFVLERPNAKEMSEVLLNVILEIAHVGRNGQIISLVVCIAKSAWLCKALSVLKTKSCN